MADRPPEVVAVASASPQNGDDDDDVRVVDVTGNESAANPKQQQRQQSRRPPPPPPAGSAAAAAAAAPSAAAAGADSGAAGAAAAAAAAGLSKGSTPHVAQPPDTHIGSSSAGGASEADTGSNHNSSHNKPGTASTLGLTIAPGAKKRASAKTLYGAALHGLEENVTQLLESEDGRKALEAPYKDGTTPLFAAANQGHAGVVKLLLEAGANKEVRIANGATALCFAASKGHADVVRELLGAGASQDVMIAGWTPLHLAVSKGHHETVALLLKHGADADLPAANGHTPVALAIEHAHAQVLDVLLNQGNADPNKPILDRGWSPLHIAAVTDNVSCMKVLVDSGADVDIQKEDGATPLFLAAEKDKAEMIELLLAAKAQLELAARNKATPLWIAVRKGNHAAAKALLHAGANTAASVSGWPCLHIAAEQNEVEIVHELLDSLIDTEQPNTDGNTALHVACEAGAIEAAQELIKCKFIRLDFVNRRRATALCLAAHYGLVDVVDDLVRAGVNVEHQIEGAWTPALLANDQGYGEVVDILEKSGAKLDASQTEGLNPLAMAKVSSSKDKKDGGDGDGDGNNNEGSPKPEDNSCCVVQ